MSILMVFSQASTGIFGCDFQFFLHFLFLKVLLTEIFIYTIEGPKIALETSGIWKSSDPASGWWHREDVGCTANVSYVLTASIFKTKWLLNGLCWFLQRRSTGRWQLVRFIRTAIGNGKWSIIAYQSKNRIQNSTDLSIWQWPLDSHFVLKM